MSALSLAKARAASAVKSKLRAGDFFSEDFVSFLILLLPWLTILVVVVY